VNFVQPCSCVAQAALARDAELAQLGAVLTDKAKVSSLAKFDKAFATYLKACVHPRKGSVNPPIALPPAPAPVAVAFVV
jgi:hypothetical protein